jgi:hypothetical protein
VRHLGAIAEISALAVLDARQDLALCGGVALELVCHDHTRNVSQAPQQLAEEPPGRRGAAPALDQDVEDISVLVDRAPKIVLLAADADEHLVDVPLVARLWPAPLQHVGEDPAEAQAPLADALVADHDPTLGQDQLNITQAQTEAVKEPQGMLDDLGREAEATIWFETSSCRAACHGLEEAANLTLPTTLVALTRSDGRQDTRYAERNESPGGWCYVAMAIPGTLSFGPLTNRTLHLCIDMQNLFAEATPWHTPWMARVLPVVEAIAASHAERTVFTRFLPPVKADEMPGTWRRYYQRWRDLTLERLDPRLIDLVPELARLVPPALVIDKHVYSPFPPATTASRESSRLARLPLPCGGAVQHDRREPAA